METKTTFHSIKKLGVTIEQLYSEQKQINVHLSDLPHVFSLCLVGYDNEPDFKLSSFTANLWTRSNKGVNRQKYNSLQGIQKAVERLIKSKIDTLGVISYSLSDDVTRI